MGGHAGETILSVDIGNSAVKLALVDASAMRIRAAQSLPTAAVATELAGAWKALVAGAAGPPRRACISSVSAPAAARLRQWLNDCGISDIFDVSDAVALPIAIDYDTPKTLGADRIAAACFCARRFAGESCAIVGAGTAVTIDYLQQGRRFCGGAILPGPMLQWRALHEGTAGLPGVDRPDTPPVLPGRSTGECIAGGVLIGLAGAIERIISEYRCLTHGVNRVVTHGGAWPLLAPLPRLDCELSHEPDAVLLGAVVASAGAVSSTNNPSHP